MEPLLVTECHDTGAMQFNTNFYCHDKVLATFNKDLFFQSGVLFSGYLEANYIIIFSKSFVKISDLHTELPKTICVLIHYRTNIF